MAELWSIDQWIYTTLKADAPLTALIGGAVTPRIFADIAPQTTPAVVLPYVLYQMQAATDLTVIGAVRVWSNCLYLVRGVAETTSWGGNLETISNRIEIALHAKSGSNASGVIYSAVRESPFRLPEIAADGKQYRHAGVIVRILARAA